MIPEKPTSSCLPDPLAVELDAFVFFHLGSDAEMTVEAGEREVSIKIRHRRVFPMEVTLDPGQIEEFRRQPDRFEELLLDHLTRHRRDA